MTVLFISSAIACAVLYLAGVAGRARVLYQRFRPWTEPISCTTPGRRQCQDGAHYAGCYERYEGIDTTGEAVKVALVGGLIWPGAVAVNGIDRAVHRIVTGGAEPLPEEVAAKTRRLEAEAARLRAEQDGGDS